MPLTVLVDREDRIAISHAGVAGPLIFEADINRAPRRTGEHDVIEEGDRISARFTYNGTFSKAFMGSKALMGYQPNSTAVQMRSIDIWRVKDGKLIEHWDELNLLEVFQIGAETVRKAEVQ